MTRMTRMPRMPRINSEAEEASSPDGSLADFLYGSDVGAAPYPFKKFSPACGYVACLLSEPIRDIRVIRGPQFGVFSADLNAC